MAGKMDFRMVVMPYCLDRLEDGRYVVLNRRYKPIGFVTDEHVRYEEYPIAVSLLLTPEQARKLSWDGSEDLQRVYLYNSRTNPANGKAEMDAYLKRVQFLMALTFTTD